MTIAEDIRSLQPGAMVELFELDATALGGSITRFHAGTNGLRTAVVWQGNTYQPLPVEASGFEFNGKGQLPRPTLRIANIGGAMGALARDLDDLLGAKVTRRRTMAKYLDAVNFPARRNLLTFTEDFRNTAEAGGTRPWLQFDDTGNAVLVTQDSLLGPLGVSGPVSKLQAGTATTAQRQVQQSSTAITDTQVAAASIFAKQAEARYLNVVLRTRDTLFPYARFDLLTGDVVNFASGAAALSVSGSKSFGDGWWRLWVVANVRTGATAPAIFAQLSTSAGSASFPATAVGQGAYLWGAQLEVASAPTDYQPVAGATWAQNPTADPAAELTPDVYFVDRKAGENKVFIEFELAAAFDVAGVVLPRRPVTQNVCTWRYRVNDESSACSYTGTSYFDANDNPVGTAGADVCGKRLSSCQARFGTQPLPFGGFPGVGLTR